MAQNEELTYGDLENQIACHLEHGTHIPKEDIEAAVRMIMISVRQEVKSTPQKEMVGLDKLELVDLIWEVKAIMSNGDYAPMPTLCPKSVNKVVNKICAKFSAPKARIPSEYEILTLLVKRQIFEAFSADRTSAHSKRCELAKSIHTLLERK